jgi:hypothetical protein
MLQQWSLSWASRMQVLLFNRVSLKSIIILMSRQRLGPLKQPFSFGLSKQNPACSSVPLRHMPSLSHRPYFDHLNVWRRVQTMKLPIVQFAVSSHYCFPLRSKYLPPHSVVEYLSPGLVPLTWGTQFHTHMKTEKIVILFICICVLWIENREAKDSKPNCGRRFQSLIYS